MSSSAAGREGRNRERLSFFRQSGWMLVANGLAGLLFTLVHTPASRMAAGGMEVEYATFVALLDFLLLFAIPAGGLQAVFAKLAASAVDEPRRRLLHGAARRVLGVVVILWLLVSGVIWGFRDSILEGMRIANPWALWWTLGVGLAGLVAPVFAGLLQGTQRFFWLGNSMIASGAGRLVGVAVAVVMAGGLAAGAMAGVWVGTVVALLMSAWASRDLWGGKGGSEGAWAWLRPWLALTLGLAAGNVMMSADTLLVQSSFTSDETGFYVAAGRVGRGLVFLTMPLALVLFPKVARSAATGEPTGALRFALGATLGTGFAAAVACTLIPSLPIRVLFMGNPAMLPAAKLVPVFCWSMLPLTAAYTLVNSLLARGRFGAVPWLLLVAVAYGATLGWMRSGILERGSPQLSGGDIRDSGSLVERLRQAKGGLELELARRLSEVIESGMATGEPRGANSGGADTEARLVRGLNDWIRDGAVPSEPELGISNVRPETSRLLRRGAKGIDGMRMRRLLLEDCFVAELGRLPVRDLSIEFGRVVRTLGVFSFLLLLVAVVFSVGGRRTTPVPGVS